MKDFQTLTGDKMKNINFREELKSNKKVLHPVPLRLPVRQMSPCGTSLAYLENPALPLKC